MSSSYKWTGAYNWPGHILNAVVLGFVSVVLTFCPDFVFVLHNKEAKLLLSDAILNRKTHKMRFDRRSRPPPPLGQFLRFPCWIKWAISKGSWTWSLHVGLRRWQQREKGGEGNDLVSAVKIYWKTLIVVWVFLRVSLHVFRNLVMFFV